MKIALIQTSVALAIGLFTALPASGAMLLQTLGNPVADGAINTSGGNNIRTDWTGVTPFIADGNESLNPDYASIYVAHDSTYFYFRYVMNVSSFLSGGYNLLIDTDSDRATGFYGGSSEYSIGADRLVQGASLFSFIGGSQDAFSFNFISGPNSYDDFPIGDIEFRISRAEMGSPSAFNFVLQNDSGDYYPDGSTGGGVSGTYFRYDVSIPEPASAILIGIAGLAALSFRRRAR